MIHARVDAIKLRSSERGVAVNTCNPRAPDQEAGGSVEGQPLNMYVMKTNQNEGIVS